MESCLPSSCTVNHDFQSFRTLPILALSDQSVMNYFMIFPTDFQAYTDDPAIAAEFQQMNTEIDFVKQHAYMLSARATTTQYRLLSQRQYPTTATGRLCRIRKSTQAAGCR
ncbi:MAG: hypothetical protein ACLTER_16745 [Ruminococcus sp.]